MEEDAESIYITDLKQELLARFHSSPYYQERQRRKDVRRWSDRYKKNSDREFEPGNFHLSRLSHRRQEK